MSVQSSLMICKRWQFWRMWSRRNLLNELFWKELQVGLIQLQSELGQVRHPIIQLQLAREPRVRLVIPLRSVRPPLCRQ
ncbi:hypothetical protein EMIT0111MI5_30219 [Burkholderia sp. IT-111MI5]